MDCPFYKSRQKHFKSREIHSDMQQHAPTVVRVVWCIHKHSDWQENRLGSGQLGCNGELEKCLISLEKRGDTNPL